MTQAALDQLRRRIAGLAPAEQRQAVMDALAGTAPWLALMASKYPGPMEVFIDGIVVAHSGGLTDEQFIPACPSGCRSYGGES